MLYVHEVHEVKGLAEEAFEEAFRFELMPALAESGSARLLWFCRHAHGSGPAYHVVTVTAFQDGASWERFARRLQHGDLRPFARRLEQLRHEVTPTLLFDVEWSPLTELHLDEVPADGSTHSLSLYMEDTGWPHVDVDEYTAFWERSYFRPMRQRQSTLLDIQAVFQTAYGGGRRQEAVLMQKVLDHDGLLHLLANETPAELLRPGQFMHEALAFRDRWQSKLLRTVAWSPLY